MRSKKIMVSMVRKGVCVRFHFELRARLQQQQLDAKDGSRNDMVCGENFLLLRIFAEFILIELISVSKPFGFLEVTLSWLFSAALLHPL